MLDFKILQYATSIHPLTKEFSFNLWDEVDGYRVISGGSSISWENTGSTPTTRCVYSQTADCLVPGYGPSGEDGWRFSGEFSNSNRTQATVVIRAVAVRELPDPEPQPEDPPEGGAE